MKTMTVVVCLIGGLTAPSALSQQATGDIVPAEWPADLSWHDIDGFERSVGTRFGTVSVGYVGEQVEGANPTVEIRMNGELVQPPFPRRNDYGIVSIKEVFELADEDVVLLAGTAGGSGSPPPLLLLVSVAADGRARVISDPALRSVDWTERVASNGDGIYFDLGYEQGQRKFASYAGGAIDIRLLEAPAVPLPAATCLNLYAAVGSSDSVCRLRQPLSLAVMRSLRALENRPGFDADRVLAVCETLRNTREAVPYASFASDVCGAGN